MAQGRASGQSFYKQLNRVKEGLDQVVPIFMEKVVTEVVRLSPVLSGEYIKAHTIEVGVRSPGGQLAGAFRKNPESQNPQAERDAALSSLVAQVQSMSKDNPVVVLSNRVPHAYKVEYAGWGSTPPYLVYQTTLSRAAQFLTDAKQEVGLK
jgi:hypothetical protein